MSSGDSSPASCLGRLTIPATSARQSLWCRRSATHNSSRKQCCPCSREGTDDDASVRPPMATGSNTLRIVNAVRARHKLLRRRILGTSPHVPPEIAAFSARSPTRHCKCRFPAFSRLTAVVSAHGGPGSTETFRKFGATSRGPLRHLRTASPARAMLSASRSGAHMKTFDLDPR